MPQFGTSNRVSVGYVAESTWGTTPSTPAITGLRFNSESLNYNAKFVTSDEIRADRMTPDTIKTSQQGDGDISGELTYATYEAFMEAAFFTTWVTTGTTTSAATDLAITVVGSVFTITSGATDWTAKSLVVGQWMKFTGFAQGTFYGQIVSIAAGALVIYPSQLLTAVASGASVTATPLNYLRNGTTKKQFTIQKAYNDLTAVTYQNFVGSRVGTWKLDLSTGQIAKTSFGIVAKDANMTTTQFSGATAVAVNTNPVMNAVDNVVGVVFDGDPTTQAYYFNSFSFTLDNALRGQEAVGTLGLIGLEPGRLKTTGSMEIYFADSTAFAKFRAATALSVHLVISDANGNGYILAIPRAKFTKMEIVAGGLDQDIFAKCDFEALVNTAGTYQVQLSRF